MTFLPFCRKFYNKYGNVGRPLNLTNQTEPTVSQKYVSSLMPQIIKSSGYTKKLPH